MRFGDVIEWRVFGVRVVLMVVSDVKAMVLGDEETDPELRWGTGFVAGGLDKAVEGRDYVYVEKVDRD